MGIVVGSTNRKRVCACDTPRMYEPSSKSERAAAAVEREADDKHCAGQKNPMMTGSQHFLVFLKKFPCPKFMALKLLLLLVLKKYF